MVERYNSVDAQFISVVNSLNNRFQVSSKTKELILKKKIWDACADLENMIAPIGAAIKDAFAKPEDANLQRQLKRVLDEYREKNSALLKLIGSNSNFC